MNKKAVKGDLLIGICIGLTLAGLFILYFEHIAVFNPEYEVCTDYNSNSCSMANIHYPVGRHKYCTLDTKETKTCCDCISWRLSNGRPEENRDYRFVGSGWLN
jgi:hypothetical protein